MKAVELCLYEFLQFLFWAFWIYLSYVYICAVFVVHSLQLVLCARSGEYWMPYSVSTKRLVQTGTGEAFELWPGGVYNLRSCTHHLCEVRRKARPTTTRITYQALPFFFCLSFFLFWSVLNATVPYIWIGAFPLTTKRVYTKECNYKFG